MEVNQINEVINNLCAKFGLGVEQVGKLIPQVARYEIVTNCVEMIICIVFVVFGVLLVKMAMMASHEKYRLLYDSDAEGLCFVLGIIAIIAGLVFFLFAADDLIQWACAPEWGMISLILKMVK